MYHTTDWRHDLSALGDHTLNVSLLTNIALAYFDFHCKGTQALDHASRIALGQAGPGCQNDVLCSLMSHPATYSTANATSTTCNKI